MTPGPIAPPPPRFTPPPECMESMSHLYRMTTAFYITPTRRTTTTQDVFTASACTPLPNGVSSCAYYNLGYGSYRGNTACEPASDTYYSSSLTPYSGCPVGYTTACAATNSKQDYVTPYWPSTEVRAQCCPTHSEYIFTCNNLNTGTTTTWNGWAADIRSVSGCVALVTAAAGEAAPLITTEVLLVNSSRVPAPDSVWIDTRTRGGSPTTTTQTVTGRLTYASSTVTSTATLQPGVDWVSAEAVAIAFTVWGQSTCYPFSGECANPAPMWNYRDYWRAPPHNEPWPVTPSSGATGIVSVLLLCVISVGFFFSVLGFWRKGRRMHERREQIRFRLMNDAARPRDTYYGQ